MFVGYAAHRRTSDAQPISVGDSGGVRLEHAVEMEES
jgi:hypothetical protein